MLTSNSLRIIIQPRARTKKTTFRPPALFIGLSRLSGLFNLSRVLG